MPHQVKDNAELSRYEITDAGRLVGVADYRIERDVVVLPHIEIDPALRGLGLGAELVRAALDAIRADGRLVVPRCSYAATFIAEHPGYQDLLAP